MANTDRNNLERASSLPAAASISELQPEANGTAGPLQSSHAPERPGLTKITLYRCGCGSLSQTEGGCLNISLGAHDGVAERRYAEPVEFIAGADIAALIDWGDTAWKLVDELRAEASRVA